MTFKPTSTLRRSLLALGLAACTSSVFAFPDKAIEMIVPWPAAFEGAHDAMAVPDDVF